MNRYDNPEFYDVYAQMSRSQRGLSDPDSGLLSMAVITLGNGADNVKLELDGSILYFLATTIGW